MFVCLFVREENEEEEGGGDDDDDESSQDEAAHSKESTPKPVEMTEEKRARLREIEVRKDCIFIN